MDFCFHISSWFIIWLLLIPQIRGGYFSFVSLWRFWHMYLRVLFSFPCFHVFKIIFLWLLSICQSFLKLGESDGTPFQYSCLADPYGQRSLVGCSPWSHEESDTTFPFTFHFHAFPFFPFPFHFHALEKEMATHSSVLARRIPGMGIPSRGSHRVRHDWSDLAAAAAAAWS